MKNILLLFAMIAFLAACGQRTAETGEVQDETPVEAVYATIQFDVTGMTCEGCENTINAAVSALEGVVEVTSSHVDAVTIVSFDPGLVNVEALQEAIRGTGYEVTGFSFVQDEDVEEEVAEPQE